MRHPGGSSGRKAAVVGCKHTTRELIEGLSRRGYSVDHCITLDPAQGERHHVAGYYDLRDFLNSHGIPFTIPRTYNLMDPGDEEEIKALGLDLILVMGWQRLIPTWFLNSLQVGAFGMHGSSRHLPYGRGRSPMNWSLIQNKTAFYTHLFKYEPGVDDGAIVGYQVFDITPFDTAKTLHYKNTLSMIALCATHLPSLLDGTAAYTPQDPDGATYYPKRSEEDGLLYWSDSTYDLYNLIRAVTRPFAGAFSYLDRDPQQKVTVWRAVPFDTKLVYPTADSGDILEVFADGEFLVKTGDSTLLVLEHEGYSFTPKDIGRSLGTTGGPRKVWENIPL